MSQIIDRISDTMRNSLEEELKKMPPEMDAAEATLLATRAIAERVKNREFHLVDIHNSGDMFALSLAEIE